MAKMFYTIEEAAGKLSKSEAEVREMAASGQLQEFRDRDRLMFKVEQVDLLAGDEHIPLADSQELESLTLASSGTGVGLAGDAKEGTGISIVEIDATEEADANAVTRVGPAQFSMQDPGKSGSGSGAGLLDLTKEADDTSLGAGLLDDVYGNETIAQQTAAEPAVTEGGGLFETSAGVDAVDPGAVAVGPGGMPMMVLAEQVDAGASGLAGGLSLGMALVLGFAIFVVTAGLAGAAGGGLLASIGANFMIVALAAAGVVLVSGILGWVVGRRA